MPIIKYKHWRPTPDIMKTVQDALSILADPEFKGLTLTLRQLYYQFIGRGLLPENTEKQYKRLGRVVTDAREAGIIDWYAIEDRGRACYFNSYRGDPVEVLKGIDKLLGRDPWQDQDVYLEAWIEKQSLEPMLARPCRERRTPYMACKGYLSASEAWRAGMRFEHAIAKGKRPVLIHLGDHDPSGMDMTRDNGDRLEFYSRQGVQVVRVALNMDQIEQYAPPELPSKKEDSREKGYRAKHGTTKSWELDSLRPSVLDKLIGDAIDKFIDREKWDLAMAKEREMREESGLGLLSARWQEVHQLIRSSEKPLERLKQLDQLVEDVSGALNLLGMSLEAQPTELSAKLRQAAILEVRAHDTTDVDPKEDPVAHSNTVGYRTARDQIEVGIAQLPDATLAKSDSELAVRGYELRDALRLANQPVPFAPPEDFRADNEYEPKDPDEEEQERFGEGPVKGD